MIWFHFSFFLILLRELLAGTQRFARLRESLPGMSPRTLSERLRTMETQGLVTRGVFAEVPSRVEYTLTDLWRAFDPVIQSLKTWGENWADQATPSPPQCARAAQPRD
ncbi:MAG: winged helix-turn-helix transcriptional regulator [Microbacteriaceae bacterium]